MCELTIKIPDQSLAALHLTPEQMQTELPLAAAMKLYEIGKLSSGAAAELAGIPKPLFLEKLADYGIDTFRQSSAELAEEIAGA